MDKTKQEMMAIGRAMLALGIQNTHSGNISVRVGADMYITKTGSMKGHLEERDICLPGLDNPSYGLFQASSETGEHRAVLQFAGSLIHAHALPVVALSYLVDAIIPLDAFGKRYLGTVPVKEYRAPIGSKEMEEDIPKLLRAMPAMVVKTHGPFVRAATLQEAFFLLCILLNSAEIQLASLKLALPYAALPALRYPDLPDYQALEPGVGEPADPVLQQQFQRSASDCFSMKLGPFQTGSASVANGGEMLYAGALATSDDFPVAIQRDAIAKNGGDYWHELHRAVYRYSNAKAALFTATAEPLVQAALALSCGQERIIPADAEGSYLYPAIPIVLPDEGLKQIVEKAARYKMVVVAGLGVLGIGHTLGHTIHHNSSLRTIALILQDLQLLQRLGCLSNLDEFLCTRGKNW